jgi:hypothetical protein
MSRLLTYDCGNCKRPRDLDVSAEECDRCERIVCPDCWDDTFDRCIGCLDGKYVTDEDVTDAIQARPGSVADDVWRVIRFAWLGANPGKKAPPPYWWRDRVNEEIKALRKIGVVECHHGEGCPSRRSGDKWPLCEWRVVEEKAVAS